MDSPFQCYEEPPPGRRARRRRARRPRINAGGTQRGPVPGEFGKRNVDGDVPDSASSSRIDRGNWSRRHRGPVRCRKYGGNGTRNSKGEETPDGDATVYVIQAEGLKTCPHVEVHFGKVAVRAIVDTGSQVYVIAEGTYRRLMAEGSKMAVLPVASTVLVSAFGAKSQGSGSRSCYPLPWEGTPSRASSLSSLLSSAAPTLRS
jgi:hypothetical protein